MLASAVVAAQLRTGVPFSPGEVLIRYKAGATILSSTPMTGATTIRTVLSEESELPKDGGALNLAQITDELSMEQAIKLLELDPDVEFAEPNWEYFLQAQSNGPQYTSGKMWGMYSWFTSPRNDYGSGAGDSWLTNPNCNNVFVALTDGGVMRNHEDLQANMWINPYDPNDGCG